MTSDNGKNGLENAEIARRRAAAGGAKADSLSPESWLFHVCLVVSNLMGEGRRLPLYERPWRVSGQAHTLRRLIEARGDHGLGQKHKSGGILSFEVYPIVG